MNLKKKRGGLNERKIWTDIGISMNLKKKKDGVLDEQKIWTDVRISMNLKEKRGGLNERKIWTDIRISMNLKKKDGFWTNGRLQKNKQQKKKLSPDLSESLTRFTMN